MKPNYLVSDTPYAVAKIRFRARGTHPLNREYTCHHEYINDVNSLGVCGCGERRDRCVSDAFHGERCIQSRERATK